MNNVEYWEKRRDLEMRLKRGVILKFKVSNTTSKISSAIKKLSEAAKKMTPIRKRRLSKVAANFLNAFKACSARTRK